MVPRRRRLALTLITAAILLLIGGRLAAEFLVELFWFRSLDVERVFWVRWGAELAARSTFGLLVGAFVFWNLWIVTRTLGTIRVRRRYANIEIAERLPQSYVVGALLLIALFSAWWLSAGVSDAVFLLGALRPAAWGVSDPVFGRDLSFFVFRLPFLDRLQILAGVLVFWTALLVAAAYIATGAVRVAGGRPAATAVARRHLGLLAAAFLLVVATDAWLDRYALLLEGSGVGGAFGYTDANARLPGTLVVAATALLAAAAVAYGAWKGRRREALASLVLLVLVSIGTRVIYPSLLQKLVVEPNEFPRESRYIAQHLEFTRRAYGLGDLSTTALPYQESETLQPEQLLQALAGAPLWDARPLLDAFEQQQSLFPYYTFVAAQPDRYGPPGDLEQVAVAVREFDRTRLAETAQTWQNLHLTYVSGQGAVATPVARMQPNGSPLYYLWDLDPPKLAPGAPPELQLTDPTIYFGQRTEGYVLVDSDSGARGVQLDASWRKLLFAWAFQSKNLFLSGDLTPESRIVYRRQVVERVEAIAPFLDFPTAEGVYPVVWEGRVVWIVDAYTTTDSYPLAPLLGLGEARVRYVRNSVKATVDALTGEVALYVVDPADPLLQTYARIFPDLFRPVDEMPGELQRHLRFPIPLMELQSLILGDYHLTDPRAFYAKEDVWAVATETYRTEAVPIEPNFVILELPGFGRSEFLLTIPFVSRGRQNMTALLVARNDPPHYGEQILYQFPRDEQIPGPQQVEAMIEQNPEISQELSLWRRGGSDVIRGHITVVPIDSTLVYVEPVFLVAETGAIPQLERVILSQGREVVMRPTLETAVAALLGSEPADSAADAGATDDENAATPAPGVPGRMQEAETMERVRRLFERAETQLRNGDWAAFGRTWNALREVIRGASAPEPPLP